VATSWGSSNLCDYCRGKVPRPGVEVKRQAGRKLTITMTTTIRCKSHTNRVNHILLCILMHLFISVYFHVLFKCFVCLLWHLYIWQCPINCLCVLCEQKTPTHTKKEPVPKPSCPGESKETASQPVSHQASSSGRSGGPANLPASGGLEQPGPDPAPKADPKFVRCRAQFGCPSFHVSQKRTEPGKKIEPILEHKQKWFQSHGVQESPSSQPASQSDKQQAALASRPASQPARTQSRQAQIPVRKWTLHGSKCGPSEHLLQTPLRAHPRKIIITMSISRKKNEPSPETKVRSQSRAVQQSPKGPPVSHAASRCGRPASLPDCQPGPGAARFKSWAQNGV
jgi:hypothetical protein